MITSLQHELANPAIAAFVDAVDVTLNSNTHVMRFDLGGMPDDPGQAICKLVHSDVFADTIIAGDAGFWDNYQSTELLDGVVRQTRRPGTLLVPTPRIMCTSLTPYGFIDRLVMFIASRRASPYGHQMPLRHAYNLAAYFLGALFGVTDARRLRGCHQRSRLVSLVPADVKVVRARPDFLNSTGYFDPKSADENWDPVPHGRLAYFDGGRGDACVVIFRGARCTVILTNGSP